MKKTILLATLLLGSTLAMADCVISNTPGHRFCVEKVEVKTGETVKFDLPNESNENFKLQGLVGGWSKISYKGQTIVEKSGVAHILNSEGKEVGTFPVKLSIQNHLEGAQKMEQGAVKFFKSLQILKGN